MITMMVLYITLVVGSLDFGSPVTKSMEMSSYGALGSSITCISLYFMCVACLFCWYSVYLCM